MSAALPLDLDLEDLETARDEIGEAILDLTELGAEMPSVRSELSATIFRLGSVRSLVVQAIDACTEPEVKP